MRTVPKLLDRFISAVFALVLPLTLHAGDVASPAFVESVFVSGLSEPVSIAWAPDASRRLFVTEKSTGIRVIQNGVLLATPFATFPQLYSQGECGVLGLCFDPNYVANHYVYVFVTVSESSNGRHSKPFSDFVGTRPTDSAAASISRRSSSVAEP